MAAKNLGGRPTKMTQETIAKLEQAFSMGCGDREACLFANISLQTLYTYQHKHPEFTKRKEVLKENPVLLARMTIVKDLKDKKSQTAMWFLERKKKDEFSPKIETELKLPKPIKYVKDGDTVLTTDEDPNVIETEAKENEPCRLNIEKEDS